MDNIQSKRIFVSKTLVIIILLMGGLCFSNFACALSTPLEDYDKQIQDSLKIAIMVEDHAERERIIRNLFDSVYDRGATSNIRREMIVEILRAMTRQNKSRERIVFFNNDVKAIDKECGSKECLPIFRYVAGAHLNLQEFDEAKVYYKKIEDMLELNLEPLEQGETYLLLAQGYVRTSDYSKGIAYISKAITIFSNDTSIPEDNAINGLSTSHVFGGNTYSILGDYENAAKFFEKAIDYATQSGVASKIASAQYNTAFLYAEMKDWVRTEEFAKQSAVLGEEIKDPVLTGYSIELLARAAYAMGRVEESLLLIDRAVLVFLADQFYLDAVESWGFKASFFIKEGKWADAKEVTKKMETMILEHNLESPEEQVYQPIHEVHAKEGDYENAYYFYRTWSKVRQDELKSRMEQQSARLLMNFELGLAKNESERLQKDVQLAKALLEKQIAQRDGILNYSATASIILIFMFYVFYKERAGKARMTKLALMDSLTGAPNRRNVDERAKALLLDSTSGKKKFSIALVDLDFFKKVNDTYGHDVGDEVLKNFVTIANQNLRDGDTLGRYGGEEFVLLLPSADEVDVQKVFDRIQTSLQLNTCIVGFQEQSMPISMSMGAVVIDRSLSGYSSKDAERHLKSIVKIADDLVYQAKNKGRGCVVMGTDQVQELRISE